MCAVKEGRVRTEPFRGIFSAGLILLTGALLLQPATAVGQGSVASTSIRPFVTAIIPVVGTGGAVGGVTVDATGVVARSDVDALGDFEKRAAVHWSESATISKNRARCEKSHCADCQRLSSSGGVKENP